MRYLTLAELLKLYEGVMAQSGGAVGIGDLGMVQSALARPRQMFSGRDEIVCSVDEQERFIFAVAAGRRSCDDVVSWLRNHLKKV